MGLLSMAKSGFEAIENKGSDGFFRRVLGLRAVPLAATLRQRPDEIGPRLAELTDELPVPLRTRARAAITPLPMGRVALNPVALDPIGRREG